MMAGILLIIMFGLPVSSYIFDKRDFKLTTEKELDKPSLKIIDKLSKLSDKPRKYWIMR